MLKVAMGKTEVNEMSRSSGPLLVAWAPFSPTLVEIGSLVGGRVVFLNVLFGKKLAAPLRYAFLALRTLSLLGRERPRVVLAQNPPIFLPVLLVLIKPLYRFKLIIDHHAVWSMKTLRQPLLSQGIAAHHDFIPKPTTTTQKVREWTANPLPPHHFLVIAAHGGHPQELLEEEIAAVSGLQDYLLAITGKREKLGRRIARLGPKGNVIYPGYLDDASYEALKRSADVAVSLSTEINTVPHAIHEYLALGIPTIVLKDPLLRSIFDGAIVEIDDARPETVRTALKRVTEDSVFRSELRKNRDRNYDQRSEMYRNEVSKLKEALTA